MKHKYITKQKKQEKTKRYFVIVSAFLFLFAVIMFVFNRLDNENGKIVPEGASTENVIEVSSEAAVERAQDSIDYYLLIGNDHSESREGVPLSDVVMLLAYNKEDQIYMRMAIDRNTVLSMPYLAYDEEEDIYEEVAWGELQLAYSYLQGDGAKISCENTVKAVSSYLGDITIKGYLSLSMDAIAPVSDLVGGVTVAIEDDFSEVSDQMTMGEEVLLKGEDAYHFVHDRMNIGDGTNKSRMRRQSAYMTGLTEAIREELSKDKGFALALYDAIDPYMVTSLSSKEFTNLAVELMHCTAEQAPAIEGEVTINEDNEEIFTPNPASLESAIEAIKCVSKE